jgi:dihydrolipoamide dehydrogenase
MVKVYDVIVIGAGPGGYVAAIRSAQLGLRTACVEKWTDQKGAAVLGGTCLNVGCIPSKTLLESTQQFLNAKSYLDISGVEPDDIKMDVNKMLLHKNTVVNNLTNGVAELFKANGVTLIHGVGRLLSGKNVEVTARHGEHTIYSAENVILSPGSSPIEIPQAPFTEGLILDSSGALDIKDTPNRLGIIGSGAIGLEIGSVWSRLGATVTIIEALPSFLTLADKDISRAALRALKKQSLNVKMSSNVIGTEIIDSKEIKVRFIEADEEKSLIVDKLIVAVGRRPQTYNLLAENSGVELDKRGFISVDINCRTGAPGVYAIGDSVRGPMLAHKASKEGMMVAEIIANQKTSLNYDLVPSIIYTHPELAWVGKTEQKLDEEGTEYKVGKFPFAASGRAMASGSTSGFVKVIADKHSDLILGVHIIGDSASELIAQGVIAMNFGATTKDLQHIIFAHPTISEAVHEAALSVDKRAIHIPNRANKKTH